MKFRTEYKAEESLLTLDPGKPAVLVGSCFSQNIAAKMNSCGWETLLPAGTLYNPESIFVALNLLRDSTRGLQKFESSLFQFDGLWHSRYFDSSFSSSLREDCIEEFRRRQKEFKETLSRGGTLIITLGTSIVYYHKESDLIVGNCHKMPSSLFTQGRLHVHGISAMWEAVYESLREEFPGLNVIFTVSPVRHLKDGFKENTRSKAILMLAVEEICRYNEGCHYFPAFEIIIDDLRDYRFYASDLLHPSEEAIEYVWDKFCDTYLDPQGKNILAEGARKMKASLHRPMTGALGKPLKNN